MRRSGILMHISSLPSSYGIGGMGKSAYDFVDFLRDAGQSVWQLLPIHPTGYGDSPYQALSTFAGNPYFVDLNSLASEGLLTREELKKCDFGDDRVRVDYGKLSEGRPELLYKAFERFDTKDEDFVKFVEDEKWWLEDYALFMAIKTSKGGRPWTEWEPELKNRDSEALEECRRKMRMQCMFHCFVQYKFHVQWKELREYAHSNGVSIIGDVPIYVPMDSADVWANPELFQLDDSLQPVVIAGCPPDAFSADGQRWGNPIYDWEKMEEDGFAWWIKRLRAAIQFYDSVRIDHFRGIESYWAIPAEEETAVNGEWRKGPGMKLINAIKEALPEGDFIAEDLGFLTDEVIAMREQSGFPGMKILQFAFDSRESGNYMPYTYLPESICYTGTHDNETLVQWEEEVCAEDLEEARRYMQIGPRDNLCKAMIRLGMNSVSNLFIAQLQDYLQLGASARMNKPSTLSGDNWTWRAKKSEISKALAKEIYTLTKRSGRLVKDK